jgi:hypothetical protein
MTAQSRPSPARRASPGWLSARETAIINPLRIVEARELGGWVVVDAATLKVVEPGYLWRRRDHALAWARKELVRQQRDAVAYRRRQEALTLRGPAS